MKKEDYLLGTFQVQKLREYWSGNDSVTVNFNIQAYLTALDQHSSSQNFL